MTQPATFDERARRLTQSLLAEAERTPSRLRRNPNSHRWKAIVVFAATVLVIGGVIAGASVALHGGSVAKPLPAHHAAPWNSFQLPGGAGGSAISCPDSLECVAVDFGGHVYVSTNPAGGTAAWKVASVEPATALPPGKELTGVSCPDPSLCVAVDLVGNIVTSTNPAGGAAAWTLSTIDRQANLNGISCPDVNLCVAVGGLKQEPPAAGLVFTSTNPAGGPSAWTATEIDGVADLTVIACPTATFCVAADGLGNLLTSTDPTGGTHAWRLSSVPSAFSVTAISCPTAHLCVAVDKQGGVVTSTDPLGSASTWTRTTLDGSLIFMSVACPTTTFCIAGAQSDYAFVSNDPTGGSGAWTRTQTQVIPNEAMVGLSCPSSGLCVGIDSGDGVHVYTKPAP
jgi:hypothetical protein